MRTLIEHCKRGVVALTWVIALAVPGAVVQAAECAFPGRDTAVADYKDQLGLLRVGCLGDPKNDQSELVKAFEGLTNEPINLDQSERLVKAVDLLLTFAREHAIALQTQSAVAPLQLQPAWGFVADELEAVRKQMDTLKVQHSKRLWLDTVQKAVPPKWANVIAGEGIAQLDETPAQARERELGPVLPLVNGKEVRPLASVGCIDKQPCPAFQSQMDLVRVSKLMSRLAGYAQGPFLAEQYEEAKLALAQWESYQKGGKHQYIWEVWANSVRMGKDLCPEDAGSRMKMGFCKVPTSQLIVFHIEPAVRLSRTAKKSSELKPALMVELLGYYSWDWKKVGEKETADMVGRKGVSLAASYTNTDGEARRGFGPMFHMGNWSLALTKASGGRWSAVVNVALADRIFERKDSFIEDLKSVRKRSLLDMIMND